MEHGEIVIRPRITFIVHGIMSYLRYAKFRFRKNMEFKQEDILKKKYYQYSNINTHTGVLDNYKYC